MARISIPNGYQAQRSLSNPGAPQVRLSDAKGRALQKLGSAIGSLSSVGSSMASAAKAAKQREEEKENFDATNGYNALKLRLGQEMQNSFDNNDSDGSGFHDTFVTETYRPARDQFLSGLPDRLRERYETMLNDDPEAEGSDFARFSVTAATNESNLRRNWFQREIATNQEQLAKAISVDPEGYEDYLSQGQELINQSGLLPHEKRTAEQKWNKFAAVSYMDKLLEDRPEEVLRQLGVDPRQASPQTKKALLINAVKNIESSFDPKAISPKGAAGLMGVIPDTAREIAGELKDRNFPSTGDDEDVQTYLGDPAIGERYGTHYLGKMLRQYNGDVEAALVAYNGGPSRADAWIKAGRDDAVLPKETREYYKKVLVAAGATASQDADGNLITGTATTMPPAEANRYLKRVLTSGKGDSHVDEMKPEFQSRLASLLQAAPPEIRRDLGIYSGARSVEHQERLWKNALKKYGSAEAARKWVAPPGKSRHNHGDAADLAYKGSSLSKAPANVVNWLHDNAAAHGLKFPLGNENWHIEMSETRGGTQFKPGLDGLSYEQRQAYTNSAEKAVANRYAAATVSPVEKVEMRRQMENEIANYRESGSGTADFDEQLIVDRLGADDYSKWAYKRDQAVRIHKATDDIATLMPDQMLDRLDDYKTNPGKDGFASDLEVHEAVQNEVDRVTKLRAKDPAAAAMEFPDIRAKKEEIDAKIEANTAEPGEVRALVDLMLDRQKMFDIPPSARAPIPKDWGMTIGRQLSDVPDVGPGVKRADIRNRLVEIYTDLETQYGDKTDEVIVYALSVYKGIEKDTASLVGAYMTAIGAGKDPLKLKDLERQGAAVQETLGAVEPDEPEALSPEALLRQRDQLRNGSLDD